MNTDNQVIQLQKRIEELEDQNRLLLEKVDYLTHKLFGRSSEQTSSLAIEGQMSIFDEAEGTQDPKAAELVLCQEKVQIKWNKFFGFLARNFVDGFFQII